MTSEVEQYVDVVFDGPPVSRGGRLIDILDAAGQSISIGEWIQDGHHWRLRIRAAEIRSGER